MHILILKGVQNVGISIWRNGHILIENLLLKLFFFQDEGHLYGISLLYILSIYCKILQFWIRGIDVHIPILTEFQNERISKNAKITHILSIGAFK